MSTSTTERIKNGDAGVMVVLNASDLKDVITTMCKAHDIEREKAAGAKHEKATLTRPEVARMLNVGLSTLWRWAKIGYLTPVKVGTKVLYRASDINALLEKKGGAA